MVSNSALSRCTISDILKIHSPVEQSLSAFDQHQDQIYFENGWPKVRVEGTFPHSVKTFINDRVPTSQFAFDNGSSSHTGHHFIRYMANSMMADNLSRIKTKIANNPGFYTIIDLGSKYAKTRRWFEDMLANMGSQIHLITVRPDDNIYDMNYHDSHNYDDYVSADERFVHTHYIGRIQDVQVLPDFVHNLELCDDIIYFLNDVHYYLAGWTPPKAGHVYVSGGLFPAAPGNNYLLPFGNGHFDIYPSKKSLSGLRYSKVRMTTFMSGEPYDHPNVIVSN